MRLTIQVSTGKLWTFVTALFMLTAMSCGDGADDLPTVISDIKAMESALGKILTDRNGRSLYMFAGDAAGRNTCDGDCLDVFTVFTVDNLIVPGSLPSEYFGTINRSEGEVQVTYKGWPLYYFTYDNRIGDVGGDGKDGTWFVAKTDYDIMLAEQEVEGDNLLYLVDGFGNSLYHWTNDNSNQSNCAGGCLVNRPLFNSSEPVIPSVLERDNFNDISTGNRPQTTYKQRPLYYFIHDNDRGQTNGHGTSGEWFLEDIQ